ncbi:hypothetical protein ACA910_019492 [Epithemia clementina (nom. ined.)]
MSDNSNTYSSFNAPCSPAYTVEDQEPYVPTNPEYHPPNDEDIETGQHSEQEATLANRSTHSHSDQASSQNSRDTYSSSERATNTFGHRTQQDSEYEPSESSRDSQSDHQLVANPTETQPEPDHVANPQIDSVQVANPAGLPAGLLHDPSDLSDGSVSTATPPTSVSDTIHRRRSTGRNGYRRTGYTAQRQRGQQITYLQELRLNTNRVFTLAHSEVVTDETDLRQLYLLLLRDPRGQSIRRTLHVERITGRFGNRDPILLIQYRTSPELFHEIHVSHNSDYDPELEPYASQHTRLALRFTFRHTRHIRVNLSSLIFPFPEDTQHSVLPTSLNTNITAPVNPQNPYSSDSDSDSDIV